MNGSKHVVDVQWMEGAVHCLHAKGQVRIDSWLSRAHWVANRSYITIGSNLFTFLWVVIFKVILYVGDYLLETCVFNIGSGGIPRSLG